MHGWGEDTVTDVVCDMLVLLRMEASPLSLSRNVTEPPDCIYVIVFSGLSRVPSRAGLRSGLSRSTDWVVSGFESGCRCYRLQGLGLFLSVPCVNYRAQMIARMLFLRLRLCAVPQLGLHSASSAACCC